MTAYERLEARFKDLSILYQVSAVLHWDAAVMMPPGGADPRSEQLAAMSALQHARLTESVIGDLLAEAEGEDLTDWQQANLREMQRSYRRASAVPSDLVDALSRAGSACEHTWRDAKKNNDFVAVQPLLQTLVDLTREEASALSEALEVSPYDALLDGFEPDARIADIEPVFDAYAAFLPTVLDEILERQASAGAPPQPVVAFPVDKQTALVRTLAETVGFEFDRGRMDVSAHPFSTGYAGDRRITTGFHEDDPGFAIMAVLHETGHSIYEQNLPADWRYQPVGQSRGMQLHESQSLLFEMQACRSDAFLAFLGPKLEEAFGADPAFEPENLRKRYRRVERSLIRVDADEATYPMHVILRTRLERAILSGDLALADLPGAWMDGMEALLGIRPPDDRRGCLQDIHWYSGGFGYFPTYTLGAMTAAQLFRAAVTSDPSIPGGLETGNFEPLRAWLTKNVHRFGSRYTTEEVLTEATGGPLDPTAFEKHIRARYLDD